jgi:hypothetical protein
VFPTLSDSVPITCGQCTVPAHGADVSPTAVAANRLDLLVFWPTVAPSIGVGSDSILDGSHQRMHPSRATPQTRPAQWLSVRFGQVAQRRSPRETWLSVASPNH